MGKIAFLAVAGLVIAGCQALAREDKSVVETHETMVQAINPAALVIWDVTDEAKSETEGLDPALMDDLAWSKLQRAAQSLEFSSRRMAEAKVLRVGAHTAQVPGFANRQEIQTKLDANPNWFRSLSAQMAQDALELNAAATAHNLRLTRDLAQNLSTSCQTCHTRYWEKPRSR
jgi:hypothetical protein